MRMRFLGMLVELCTTPAAVMVVGNLSLLRDKSASLTSVLTGSTGKEKDGILSVKQPLSLPLPLYHYSFLTLPWYLGCAR